MERLVMTPPSRIAKIELHAYVRKTPLHADEKSLRGQYAMQHIVRMDSSSFVVSQNLVACIPDELIALIRSEVGGNHLLHQLTKSVPG